MMMEQANGRVQCIMELAGEHVIEDVPHPVRIFIFRCIHTATQAGEVVQVDGTCFYTRTQSYRQLSIIIKVDDEMRRQWLESLLKKLINELEAFGFKIKAISGED